MSKNKKVLAAIAALALVVVAAGGGYAEWGGSSSSSESKNLVILDNVQRRTLSDTVTLTGTLAREEQRKVTSVAQGRASARSTRRTVRPHKSTTACSPSTAATRSRSRVTSSSSGRCRSATAATTSCNSSRSSPMRVTTPGRSTRVFTEQTRFALAQWQAANHYPGATPETAQTALGDPRAVDRLHDRRAVERGPDHRPAGYGRERDCGPNTPERTDAGDAHRVLPGGREHRRPPSRADDPVRAPRPSRRARPRRS